MLKPYPKMKDSGVEWIGEIPEHWKIESINRHVIINQKTLSEDTKNFFEIKYIDIRKVSDGKIYDPESMNFLESPSRARRIVSTGDTIVSTVRTYLRSIAIIDEAKDGCICSTGFAVLSPQLSIEPKFLYYLISSEKYVATITANSVGVAYPSINSSLLGKLSCILPPIKEQQMIGKFLKEYTNRLDEEIDKNKKLIELLRNKKQIMINQSVTKGLDKTVQLKDSRIGWMEKIPEHWNEITISTLKQMRVILDFQDGNHGELHPKGEDFKKNGIPFLTANCIKQGQVLFEKCSYLTPEFVSKLRIGFSKPGDVILTHKGTIGETAIIPKTHDLVMLSPQTTYYRVSNKISNIFLQYVFQAKYFQEQLFVNGKQSTRYYVGLINQKTLFLVIPPIDKQKQIVNYLDKEINKIDDLVFIISCQIKKLEEFKKSLISSVITGKIDVTSLAQ